MPKIISIKEYCEANNLSELFAEYSSDNASTPDRIGYTSRREVKWVCKHGHSEFESPYKRFRRGYCKTCGKEQGGSLLQRYPEIAKYWSKDNKLSASEISPTFSGSVKWECEKGHTWERSIAVQLEATSPCPICKSENNAFFKLHPELLCEWDSESNMSVDPMTVSNMCNIKYKWICKNGHCFEATPSERARRNKSCPTCNSLGFKFPEVANEWHPTKNDCTPFEVAASSNKSAWFICKNCGQDYLSIIKSRAKRVPKTCPHCR